MKPFRRIPVLSMILLLAKAGHMSSGIERIDLGELVRRSHAILLVKKDAPYAKVEALPFPNPADGHFQAASTRFRVLKVIRDDEGLVKGRKIQVFAAHVEDNFEQTKRAMAGNPVAMTIFPSYHSEGSDPERDSSFIIFVRYHAGTKRFSFAANGAMEKAEREAAIRSGSEGRPPSVPK